MLARIELLTPLAGLVGLAVAVPLVALALAARRERRGREVLRLRPPRRASRAPRVAALAAVPLLLAFAAMQPAVRSTRAARVRTDAELFFVIDVSRSMLAAASPAAPTRLDRARAIAIRLRDALPEAPAGVATLTDRVLPDLLPSTDVGTFEQTVRRAVQIEQPPPSASAVEATSLGALGALGTQGFFAPRARRRVAIVLTDAESKPFDAGAVARSLRAGPGVRLVLVRLWSGDEAVYSGGRPEPGYRPDPASAETAASLAVAAGGMVVRDEAGAAAGARAALGSGPTRMEGRSVRTRTLAPYVALAALLPLALLLAGGARSLGYHLRRVVPPPGNTS